MVNKTVIVTGASSGIGAHIVRFLVSEGANVVATGRRFDRLRELHDDLKAAPGELLPIEADVTSGGDAERTVEAAMDRFGRIDALVNNAGMEVQGRIEELARADLESMLATNVVGPYLCTRAALPYLKESQGSVVNIGSTVVTRAPLHRFGYVASKGAIQAMSRALAGDLGPEGVRVNLVRPGIVPSELRGHAEADETELLQSRVPTLQALPAVGSGTDVASVVAFLISDAAGWLTGAEIDVDGGYALGTPRP